MPSLKRKKYWGNIPKFKVTRTSHDPQSGNRFQVLSDMDTDLSSDDEGEIVSQAERVPPIIVDTNHGFSAVIKLIGNRYTFKRMSIGTKINSETLSLREDAINKLKAQKFNFYTHQVKDTKNFKLVLFGLHQINCKDISEEFITAHNIHPVSVKEIITKKSNTDDAIYMIEFDRNEITKRDVHKIRYFCGIAIHWRNPLKGNKGPTQCSKCTMYGHGARNCFRVEICPACAGNHDHSQCLLNKTQQNGPVVYKCFNCINKKFSNVNHRADDIQCPCRKEYLSIRDRLTSRLGHNTQRRKHTADFHYNADDHPQLPTRKHVSSSPITYDAFNQNKRRYSEMAKISCNVDTSDDISNERLLDIFFEAVDALQKCQNKYDKLRVLGIMLRNAI